MTTQLVTFRLAPGYIKALDRLGRHIGRNRTGALRYLIETFAFGHRYEWVSRDDINMYPTPGDAFGSTGQVDYD